jgi:hypothetical protein
VLTLGCTVHLPSQADFTVQYVGPPGEFSIGIDDDSGLVADAVQAPREDLTSNEAVVLADPESHELVVTWVGGACAHNPRIEVSGSVDALSVVLFPDADNSIQIDPPPGMPELECPAVGLFFGVTLSLRESVAQEAIDFEVVR